MCFEKKTVEHASGFRSAESAVQKKKKNGCHLEERDVEFKSAGRRFDMR